MDAMGLSNKKSYTVSTSHSGSFSHNPAESPKTPGIVSSIFWFTQCPPNTYIEDRLFSGFRKYRIDTDNSNLPYSFLELNHIGTFVHCTPHWPQRFFISVILDSLLLCTNCFFTVIFFFLIAARLFFYLSTFHPYSPVKESATSCRVTFIGSC